LEEIRVLKESYQATQGEFVDAAREMDSMKAQVERLQKVLESSDSRALESSKELDQTREILSTAEARVNELEASVRACVVERDEAQAHLESTQQLLEEERQKAARAEESLIEALEGKRRSDEKAYQLDELQISLAEATNKVTLLEDRLKSQEEDLTVSRSSENMLKARVKFVESQMEQASRQTETLEAKLAEATKELKSRSDELINVHDLVESSNSRLNEYKQKVNDLEEELESKDTMLAQSLATTEEEGDRLTSELEELKRAVQELTVAQEEAEEKLKAAEQSQSNANNIATELEDLKQENIELKQLLASSNTSVEEARAAAQTADAELEKKNRQLEEAQDRLSELQEELRELDCPNEAEGRIREVLEQKLQLEAMLEKEREDRQRSEEELKRLMGEEQRILIQEAEQTMSELREETARLQEALKNSETEAYTARQLKEELQDQYDLAVQRANKVQERIAAMESENSSLRRASNRQNTEKESEIASLTTDLQKMTDARDSALRVALDHERRLELLEQEKEDKQRELASVLETMSRFDVPGIEAENQRLQSEIENLQSRLAVAMNTQKENVASTGELTNLRAQLAQMQKNIRTKDERIKRLEQVKLTKEKVAAFRKLKVRFSPSIFYVLEAIFPFPYHFHYYLLFQVDNAEYEQKLRALEEELSVLRQRPASSDGPEDSEITSLRFHKEALEKKLRKFAKHCQRLEDERASILHAVQSSKPVELDEADLSKAFVALCDKIASLEKECDSLSNIENRASSYMVEVEQLRSHNSLLQGQVTDQRSKVDRLLRAEVELKETVAQLRREREDLRRAADQARGNASTLENERRRLQYLERENLQLMNDLKTAKKQQQSMKAELNVLRAQSIDDSVEMPKPKSQSIRKSSRNQDCSSPNRPPMAPHPSTKENSENALNDNPTASKAVPPITSSRTRRAPGLAEAFEPEQENTQECKNQ
jgi:chromosome segregation ATPase